MSSLGPMWVWPDSCSILHHHWGSVVLGGRKRKIPLEVHNFASLSSSGGGIARISPANHNLWGSPSPPHPTEMQLQHTVLKSSAGVGSISKEWNSRKPNSSWAEPIAAELSHLEQDGAVWSVSGTWIWISRVRGLEKNGQYSAVNTDLLASVCHSHCHCFRLRNGSASCKEHPPSHHCLGNHVVLLTGTAPILFLSQLPHGTKLSWWTPFCD